MQLDVGGEAETGPEPRGSVRPPPGRYAPRKNALLDDDLEEPPLTEEPTSVELPNGEEPLPLQHHPSRHHGRKKLSLVLVGGLLAPTGPQPRLGSGRELENDEVAFEPQPLEPQPELLGLQPEPAPAGDGTGAGPLPGSVRFLKQRMPVEFLEKHKSICRSLKAFISDGGGPLSEQLHNMDHDQLKIGDKVDLLAQGLAGCTIEHVVKDGLHGPRYDIHVPGETTKPSVSSKELRRRFTDDRFLLKSGHTAVDLGPVCAHSEPRLAMLLGMQEQNRGKCDPRCALLRLKLPALKARAIASGVPAGTVALLVSKDLAVQLIMRAELGSASASIRASSRGTAMPGPALPCTVMVQRRANIRGDTLRKRARQAGVNGTDLEQAEDESPNPRAAIIELIVAATRAGGPSGGGEEEEEAAAEEEETLRAGLSVLPFFPTKQGSAVLDSVAQLVVKCRPGQATIREAMERHPLLSSRLPSLEHAAEATGLRMPVAEQHLSEPDLDRIAAAVRDERNTPWQICRSQIVQYLVAAVGDRVLLQRRDGEAYAGTERCGTCPMCNFYYESVPGSKLFGDLDEDWPCPTCQTPKSKFGAPATVFDYNREHDLYGLITDPPLHAVTWASADQIQLHPLVVNRWRRLIEGARRESKQNKAKLTPLLGRAVQLNEILSLHYTDFSSTNFNCCRSVGKIVSNNSESLVQQVHDLLLKNNALGRHDRAHVDAALRELKQSYCERCQMVFDPSLQDAQKSCMKRIVVCTTDHPSSVIKRFPAAKLDEIVQSVLQLAETFLRGEAKKMNNLGEQMLEQGSFADAAKFFAAASELCQQCDLPLFAKGEEIKALKKQEQLARKRHNKTLSHPGTGQDVEEWRELGLPRLRTRARAACWAAGIPRARSLDVQVKFHFPGFDATDGLIALMKEADAAWQQKSLPDLQRRAAELTIEGTGGKPDRHIGVSALLLEQATDSRSFADQGATVVKLIENAMSADEAMQAPAFYVATHIPVPKKLLRQELPELKIRAQARDIAVDKIEGADKNSIIQLILNADKVWKQQELSTLKARAMKTGYKRPQVPVTLCNRTGLPARQIEEAKDNAADPKRAIITLIEAHLRADQNMVEQGLSTVAQLHRSKDSSRESRDYCEPMENTSARSMASEAPSMLSSEASMAPPPSESDLGSPQHFSSRDSAVAGFTRSRYSTPRDLPPTPVGTSADSIELMSPRGVPRSPDQVEQSPFLSPTSSAAAIPGFCEICFLCHFSAKPARSQRGRRIKHRFRGAARKIIASSRLKQVIARVGATPRSNLRLVHTKADECLGENMNPDDLWLRPDWKLVTTRDFRRLLADATVEPAGNDFSVVTSRPMIDDPFVLLPLRELADAVFGYNKSPTLVRLGRFHLLSLLTSSVLGGIEMSSHKADEHHTGLHATVTHADPAHHIVGQDVVTVDCQVSVVSVRLAKVVDCIVLLRACVMQCVSDDQPTVFEGTSVLASALQSHCDTKYVKKKFFRFRAGVYFPAGCVFFSAMLPALSWSLVVVDSIAVLSTALFLFYCSTNGLLDLKTLWFGFQGEWRWTFGNLRNGRQTAVPRMFHHAFNVAKGTSIFALMFFVLIVDICLWVRGGGGLVPIFYRDGDHHYGDPNNGDPQFNWGLGTADWYEALVTRNAFSDDACSTINGVKTDCQRMWYWSVNISKLCRQLAIFQSAGSMLYGVCNANDDLAMRVAYGTIVGLMDSLHAIYVSGGIFLVTGGLMMYVVMRDVDTVVYGEGKHDGFNEPPINQDPILGFIPPRILLSGADWSLSIFGYLFGDVSDLAEHYHAGGGMATFVNALLLLMVTLCISNLLIAIVSDAWAEAATTSRPWYNRHGITDIVAASNGFGVRRNRYTMAAFSVATISARLDDEHLEPDYGLEGEDEADELDEQPIGRGGRTTSMKERWKRLKRQRQRTTVLSRQAQQENCVHLKLERLAILKKRAAILDEVGLCRKDYAWGEQVLAAVRPVAAATLPSRVAIPGAEGNLQRVVDSVSRDIQDLKEDLLDRVSALESKVLDVQGGVQTCRPTSMASGVSRMGSPRPVSNV